MPTKFLPAAFMTVALLAPGLASGHSRDVEPTLSGHYVYSDIVLCWRGTPPALSTVQDNGTMTFEPSTGTAKETLFVVNGPQLVGTGFSAEASYSLVKKYLVLGSQRYRIAFGASQGGVATYATLLGITPGNDCSVQGTLSRQ